MNERIQELESQCWEPRKYGPDWFNSKKFAELIVRECLSLAQSRPSQIEDFAAGIDSVRENIKEHFGLL